MPSRTAAALAYGGWWLTGALFWFIERRDAYVRFHAAQAVAAFGLVALLIAMFGMLALLLSLTVFPSVTAGVPDSPWMSRKSKRSQPGLRKEKYLPNMPIR